MSGSVYHGQLRAFIERIERLDEEIHTINDDKREVFAEAKGNGFDVKAMKVVLQRRRMDPDKRAELDTLVDLYTNALEGRSEPRAPAPARTREIIEEFGADEANDGLAGPANAGDARTANTKPALIQPPVVSDQNVEANTAAQTVGFMSASNIAAGGDAVETPAPSNLVPFRSKEPERPAGCQNPVACAGTWRKRCYSCERAFTAAAVEIPHQGTIGA